MQRRKYVLRALRSAIRASPASSHGHSEGGSRRKGNEDVDRQPFARLMLLRPTAIFPPKNKNTPEKRGNATAAEAAAIGPGEAGMEKRT